MKSVASYGDLKGASLGVEMEASPNPPNPNSPTSITSPTSPSASIILPKSPTTTIEATSTLVSSNVKGRLMEFCGKNKLKLPEFKRLKPVQGTYAVQLTWSPSDSDETPTFDHSIGRPTKKEAECIVAGMLLPQLQEWISSHKQTEFGNVKGDLLLLTTKHSDRFLQPKYKVESTGLPMFSCTLCVGNIYTGEEYITTGKGVGKKIAEKDASLKMINKLTEILNSSPTEDPGMNTFEKMQSRLKTMFPSHRLEFVCQNDQPCLLKNFILLLVNENSPDIILSHGSGITEEQAMQMCAQVAFPHIDKIRELMSNGSESSDQVPTDDTI